MDLIWQKFTEWLKELLISGIMDNVNGLFDNVNSRVAGIAGQVGATPQGWNSGVYGMIRTLSDNVILPIAGVVLAFVMTLELIQLITEKNNMHDVDTWMFFKWIFKTACAVLIVTNTWNIVMGVFEAAQSVVNSASGIIVSDTSLTFNEHIAGFEAALAEMEVWSLLGLWLESVVVHLSMWALTICIFIICYGRMIEIYCVTSIAPIPMATMANREWGQMGQNYLRSLLALGFQGFLIIVCVAIYAVLIQNIVVESSVSAAIWTCMGYTVLLCFTLFKTSSLARSLERGENQGHVQFNKTPDSVLRRRRAHRRTAFLSAQGPYRQQRGGSLHDAGHAALLPAGHVRKERSAAGEAHPQHRAGVLSASQAAPVQDEQFLRPAEPAGYFG